MIKSIFKSIFVSLTLVVVLSCGLSSNITTQAQYNCFSPTNDKNSDEYKKNCPNKDPKADPKADKGKVDLAIDAVKKSETDLKKSEKDLKDAKAGGSVPQLQYQADPRIGGLAQCKAEGAPTDAEGANKYIGDCLRSVMELTVGISVIMSIAGLVWLGIRSLNAFEPQDVVNREISERVKGFTVGAMILGLFSALIGTLNPAALNINQIFSPQVVKDIRDRVDKQDFKLFGEGGDGVADTKTATGDTKSGGAGATGGDKSKPGDFSPAEIKGKLGDDKEVAKMASNLMICERVVDTVYLGSAVCDKYFQLPKDQLAKIRASTSYKPNNRIPSVSAGELSQYDWKDITVSSSGVGSTSVSNALTGKLQAYQINFKSSGDCKDTKFAPSTQNGGYSADGKTPLIPKGSSCKLTDLKLTNN